MEYELRRIDSISPKIQSDGPKSKTLDFNVTNAKSVRLSPEQIDEIHSDEYSLAVFYATRIQPLSLDEVKKFLPEPESKKAQTVLTRFLDAGLVTLDSNNKYFSTFPEGYANFSHFKYDGVLEAEKDSKVFKLMKEFSGVKEYWKNKTYFTMDAFFSEEQTAELIRLLHEVKATAKKFANENAKNQKLKGLKFRRIKFYDIFFGLLLSVCSIFFLNTPTWAFEAIVEVPLEGRIIQIPQSFGSNIYFHGGGGNDPTEGMIGEGYYLEEPIDLIGSIHDLDLGKPVAVGDRDDSCALLVSGTSFRASPILCSLKESVTRFNSCQGTTPTCGQTYKEIEEKLEALRDHEFGAL